MFLIERTGPSNIGDEVEFWCRLPAGHQIQNDQCLFKAKDGAVTFFTKPSEGTKVYNLDSPDTPITGLEAKDIGDGKNICGMNITQMTEEYFGKWNCIFNQEVSGFKEHRGDFTLLTKEEMFVKDVRLPKHVVPQHYDVHLTPFIEEGNFTTSGSVTLTFTVVKDSAITEVILEKHFLLILNYHNNQSLVSS